MYYSTRQGYFSTNNLYPARDKIFKIVNILFNGQSSFFEIKISLYRLKLVLSENLNNAVPIDCLTKYYMATVQSHIDHCVTVWWYSSNANCKLLQSIQNGAARIILIILT